RSIFLEGDSSSPAGTRAIPPTTKIISNTNSKKFIIVLRLDESDDASGRQLSTPERALSESDTTMMGATSHLFPADCDQHHLSFTPSDSSGRDQPSSRTGITLGHV